MNTRTWTTRSGAKIRIKDMTDIHLMNVIRFLERVKEGQDLQAMAAACTFDIETDASYYANLSADDMAEEWVGDRFPIYHDLIEEAERRELIEVLYTDMGIIHQEFHDRQRENPNQ
jgi:hypothetical protein